MTYSKTGHTEALSTPTLSIHSETKSKGHFQHGGPSVATIKTAGNFQGTKFYGFRGF